MTGLKFFSRTNDGHWWNLASYHDPNSITWSWILSFGTRKPDERWIWFFFHSSRRRWDMCFLGLRLCWQTQSKMPYRRSPGANGEVER